MCCAKQSVRKAVLSVKKYGVTRATDSNNPVVKMGYDPTLHPTAGVARFTPKKDISGQLSSSCEELPVSEAISRVHVVLGLRHRSLVGLFERTNAFEVIFRVRY